ncbi:60S ribosomal protein L34 [Symbiodinium microadriaticum]|uniref:60S ribosomal protein L34 n=1 Tax=Symbiodinium microadriaticum TaxID=2951 RepID=A0A1Q9F4W9_SYMMI|nr:60S ribosomal protein L34 [Symbiodinium microadriaticum]
MAFRLTYRRQCRYNTKSNKSLGQNGVPGFRFPNLWELRQRVVKTPGGQAVYQAVKKKAKGPHCTWARFPYKRLKKREKRVNRAYGGSRFQAAQLSKCQSWGVLAEKLSQAKEKEGGRWKEERQEVKSIGHCASLNPEDVRDEKVKAGGFGMRMVAELMDDECLLTMEAMVSEFVEIALLDSALNAADDDRFGTSRNEHGFGHPEDQREERRKHLLYFASVTKCRAMARSLRRPGTLPLTLALVALALYSAPSFVPNAAPTLRGSPRPQRIVRYADPEEVTALAKLEQDIEAKIEEADKAEDNSRKSELARLLVLTRTSAAATAWQMTKELKTEVGTSVAAAISEFVGKEDYNIEDVATKVEEKVTSAVKKLDNVYLTADAAKAAPEGSSPIILSQVVKPVAGQIKEGAKEAALAFTGKEEYKFGDISKEAAARAKVAVATLLGKEEYQFGDVTKAAVNKAMDKIADFTGKDSYKFGDITKTLLRKTLDYLEKDD